MSKQKKYEMIPEGELFRIRALVDIPHPKKSLDIKSGEIGGLIEKESNLSQGGTGWVSMTSKVLGDAVVVNGWIDGESQISGVVHVQSGYIDDSTIEGDTQICGNITILNSTIKNGLCIVEEDCSGVIVKSTLRNLDFHHAFHIENSTIESADGIQFKKLTYAKDSSIFIGSGSVDKEAAFERVDLETVAFNANGKFGIKDFSVYAEGAVTILGCPSEPDMKTVVMGELENPARFQGNNLILHDTTIIGSPIIKGNVNLQSTRIMGMPQIQMRGCIYSSDISDFAKIDCPLSEYHKIENIHILDDNVYTAMHC
ncbi:hypothetical protein JMA_39170 (plasmid) [Jeotgalibacillus malaysiensis]|uniref:Uncharacterized protein n=1 Tax=Jeotgalibacillus malaysiensis TaxID=1508404 RepID=A0A0B5ASP9_9BACL|nr:hypothetical protein [Jeotgalibacillus malaysiensis]AJD93235.1 hypothetical protein JMA_39170 [Jeotgalibacillus malaysiensis]